TNRATGTQRRHDERTVTTSASRSRFVYATACRAPRRLIAARKSSSPGTASRLSSQIGDAKLIPGARAGLRASRDDLGRAADHPREARHRLEEILLRAELDVRLETRRPVRARVQPGDRRRKRGREQLRCSGGVRTLAVEALYEAARAIGIVEGEGPHEASAVNNDVVVARSTRRGAHRIEVEQRAEQDDVAPFRRGEDRRGAVRRREDQVACTRS